MATKKEKPITDEDAIKQAKSVNDDLNLIDPRLSDAISLNHIRFKPKLHAKTEHESLSGLMNLIGKDIKTKKSLEDEFNRILHSYAQVTSLESDTSELRANIRENRWAKWNMPILNRALEMGVDAVFSPDAASKESIGLEIVSCTNSALQADDVLKLLREETKTFDKILDMYRAAITDGYCFMFILPYYELANQFMSYMNRIKSRSGAYSGIFESYYGIKDDDVIELLEAIDGIPKTDEDEISIMESGVELPTIDKKKLADLLESTNLSVISSPREDEFEITENVDGVIKIHTTDTVITDLLPNSPIIDSCKDAFLSKICEAATEDEMMFMKMDGTSIFDIGVASEELQNKEKLNLKKMSGIYTKILDSVKVIPIIVDAKVIGVYYEEDYSTINQVINATPWGVHGEKMGQFIADARGGNSGLANMSAYTQQAISDRLLNVVRRNLSGRFVRDNKKVLSSIKEILLANLKEGGTKKRMRFIPAKYLCLLVDKPDPSNGLGVSRIEAAKASIYAWITLYKSAQMTQIYYKRNKIVASVDIQGIGTDVNSYIMNSLEHISNLYPNNNLNSSFDRDYMGRHMGTVGRIIVPQVNGRKFVDVEVVEGQRTDDDLDLLTMTEKMVGILLNSPISTDDDEAYTATSIANKNAFFTRAIIKEQAELRPQIESIVNKTLSYLRPDDNIIVKIKLNEPKSIFNESKSNLLRDIKDRANELAEILIPDSDEKIKQTFIENFVRRETAGILNWEGINVDIDAAKAEKTGDN